MRKCRFCHEDIEDAATVCQHCGRDLIPGRHTPPAMVMPTSSALPLTVRTCPFCAEEIQDAAIKCKHCGSSLTEAHADSAARPARPKYRDESAFGIFAIVVYIMFAVGMLAVGDFFGEFAVAMMLSSAILWGIISCSIAKKKGRPVRGVLLGLLLGPIGLLVVVLQD
jgi:predicted amidophosphoribosyltransferase